MGFSLHQNVQIGYGAPPSLLVNRQSGSFPVLSGLGMMLPTDLHLVPRLRMGGAIPLLPLCAFMARIGTTFGFYLLPNSMKVGPS